VYKHGLLSVCVVRILGSCALGNMQGNTLEHAEHRPSPFRCGKVLGMAVRHNGVRACVRARAHTHTHTYSMYANPLTTLPDLDTIKSET